MRVEPLPLAWYPRYPESREICCACFAAVGAGGRGCGFCLPWGPRPAATGLGRAHRGAVAADRVRGRVLRDGVGGRAGQARGAAAASGVLERLRHGAHQGEPGPVRPVRAGGEMPGGAVSQAAGVRRCGPAGRGGVLGGRAGLLCVPGAAAAHRGRVGAGGLRHGWAGVSLGGGPTGLRLRSLQGVRREAATHHWQARTEPGARGHGGHGGQRLGVDRRLARARCLRATHGAGSGGAEDRDAAGDPRRVVHRSGALPALSGALSLDADARLIDVGFRCAKGR